MARKLLPVLLGLAFGWFVLVADLPLRASVYGYLMKLRGPIPVSPAISILSFPAAASPFQLLHKTLGLLDSAPPKALQLDFFLPPSEEAALLAKKHLYPIFLKSPGREAAESAERALPLVTLPGLAGSASKEAQPDPFLTGFTDLAFLKTVAPAQVERLMKGPPRLLNIAGPPGTYNRVLMSDLFKNEELLRSFEDRIVIVASPQQQPRGRIAMLPFFPRRGIKSVDETEVAANVLDTVLQERSMRVLPRKATVLITMAVSLFTPAILFWTTPVLGILLIFLTTVLVVVASLTALNSHLYLDIQPALWTIFLAYYFLIPYRLIIEFKGRWRYQQENRLHAEVETLKDNFMSLVSHNLKTPIARISGLVETLLARKDAVSLTVREELTGILKATDDLNRFVSRILNLAQVEKPDYQLHTATKDLNTIVEKVIENHESLAKEKGIRLQSKLEPLFPFKMDGDLVAESIANLLENAVKYTPSGGSVDVITRESGNWAHVEVSDTGPGIQEDDAGKIFSKFYRGVDVKNKGVRGSGLGLYLVKYFMELHGGSVEFANRPEGGSRFTIQLPTR
jgi:signal transduction histidine kinase